MSRATLLPLAGPHDCKAMFMLFQRARPVKESSMLHTPKTLLGMVVAPHHLAAQAGLDDLYRGEIGSAIGAELARIGSPVTASDLKAHRAVEAAPLRATLRCGTVYNLPPPIRMAMASWRRSEIVSTATGGLFGIRLGRPPRIDAAHVDQQRHDDGRGHKSVTDGSGGERVVVTGPRSHPPGGSLRSAWAQPLARRRGGLRPIRRHS